MNQKTIVKRAMRAMASVMAVLTVILCSASLAAAAVPAEEAGENPLLASALAFDRTAETITLPLYQGMLGNGSMTWYVITDASNEAVAEKLGVNFAPNLANAVGTAAVQQVSIMNGVVFFEGSVDFSPERVVVPGPTVFPPAVALPGSMGGAGYSPLITAGDGVVLNAPQVANGSGLHEKVVSISFEEMRVTLRLTAGLYHGREILYLSTDASNPVAAALEESTLAPSLDAAPGIASNDPAFSARAAIVVIVNGATGAANPNRQGLVSAILGEGSPLNVTEIHPRNRGEVPLYSPLWDVHPAVWTDAALAAGERRLVDHHDVVAGLAEVGLLASGGEGPPNPGLGGLRAAGFIVNCPVMFVE